MTSHQQDDRHRTECQKLDLQELIWQNQKMADAVQVDADALSARREWQRTKLLPAVIACLRDAADATNAAAAKDAADKPAR